MKRLALVLSLVVALLAVPAAPSPAWVAHGGGGGWHGGGWHGGGQGGSWHGGSGWHGGGQGGTWHGGNWYGGGWHGGSWYGGGWHGGGWYGGGWNGAVVIGGPWWGAYPYAYPYGYYPYASYSPVVVDQGPSVYIQQPVAADAPAEGPAPAYWYYCPSSKAYYPTVQKCRVAWVKVPPMPQ